MSTSSLPGAVASSSTLPSTGRATVKSVSSSDTFVVRGKPSGGPPPEMTFSLAGIIAPRMNPKEQEKEEPFAFEAREFLRTLLIGKEVAYKVEYTISNGNRCFGTASIQVPVNGETNLARLVIKEGWAKVKPVEGKRQPTEEHLALIQLEEEARTLHRGIWQEAPAPTRTVNYTFDQDARAFLQKFQNVPIDAILEQVRDGSTYRMLLMYKEGEQHIHQYITLNLSGIKAPTFRKDVPNVEDLVEPFSEEAKFFVEARLLHRQVRVLLESVQGSGSSASFIGSVQFPAGNIAEALLSEGLAKVVEWNLAVVTGGGASYRAAEEKAKARQVRLWRGHVHKADAKKNNEFEAIVTRVIGPDLVLVESVGTPGKERKLQLSSVRGPKRQKNESGQEIGYYHDAVEFLRSRLIGKKVSVKIDYVKPAEGEYEERTCATIMNGDQNIAEALVSKGLANVIRHKRDDHNRSASYDRLVQAEERAKAASKGIHSTKDLPIIRIVDASENTARARQYLSSFQRAGSMSGVLEFVSSASRFKVTIPSQSARITFVLSGIRAPRTARNSSEKSEPFGDAALAYVNRKALQRDVDVLVESMDKVGGFIGTIFVHQSNGQKVNLAVDLVEAGFATVFEYSAQASFLKSLQDAETKAKKNKRNIWSTYDEAAELAAKAESEKAQQKNDTPQVVEVVVSDINPNGLIHIQILGEELKKLEALLVKFAVYHRDAHPQPGTWSPKPGEYCSALDSADKSWYRAKVKGPAGPNMYLIQYIDYGNCEKLPLSALRPLPPQFSVRELAPQAQEAKLAHIQFPEDDEFSGDALRLLQSLVQTDKLVALVEKRSPAYEVVLYNQALARNSGNRLVSINEKLVESGLATVPPALVKRFEAQQREKLKNPAAIAAALARNSNPSDQSQKDVLEFLVQAQDSAKSKRIALWRYGDFTADDEL